MILAPYILESTIKLLILPFLKTYPFLLQLISEDCFHRSQESMESLFFLFCLLSFSDFYLCPDLPEFIDFEPHWSFHQFPIDVGDDHIEGGLHFPEVELVPEK